MSGRYGMDQMNIGLLVLYAILGFVRIFVRNTVGYSIIYGLMAAVFIYMIFRVLSRNIYNRQKENAVFTRYWNKVKPKLILFKDRITNIKTYRYRTCPKCKKVLRLPVRKGKHNVRCPHCGEEFKVRIL